MILHKKKQVAHPKLDVPLAFTHFLSIIVYRTLSACARVIFSFFRTIATPHLADAVLLILYSFFSVRISSQIRTNLSISGEKRGKFCLKIIFCRFFVIFQLWKFTARILRLRPPPAPDLLDAESIAPVSFPCIYYFCVR